MNIPVIVNLQIIDKFGNKNIVAGVVDFHPSNIKEIINGADEHTTVLYTADNRALTLMIPFKEAVELYIHNKQIVGNYKDDVYGYLKDNWAGYRDSIKNNKDSDGESYIE